MISALQHKSKYKLNSISNFLKKKIKFYGSHVVVLVKTFPLTYQLLFEFRTFLKKNPIFGFPWCSTREDLSIDVSITN